MKIFISVDLEGICGTTHWDEVTRGNEAYPEFRKQMTAEVIAACNGAFSAGATEIYIRDAHDSARNIIARDLPEETVLIRGWSRHPYMMMQEIDATFDAALMIGYHSLAAAETNPLSHTMSTTVSSVTINGVKSSEFLINWYTARYENVPVAFVSGDKGLCDHAAEQAPTIHTVAVKAGTGDSSINLHPQTACAKIEDSVRTALSQELSSYLHDLPTYFDVSVSYIHHQDAYRNSFYPGARLIEPGTVGFQSNDYFEVLRFFLFAF